MRAESTSMRKNTSRNRQPSKKIAYTDSVYNQYSGIGTINEKAISNILQSNNKSEKDLLELYENSWLAAKIVDDLADESTSKWRISTISNTNLIDLMDTEEKRLDVKEFVADVSRELYIFGICYVVLITDSQDNTGNEMLPTEEIQKLVILKRDLVVESTEVVEEFNEYFNTPQLYTYNSAVKFHHTRIVKLTALYKSIRNIDKTKYKSPLQLMYDDILSYEVIMRSVTHLIQDSSIAIHQSTGLHSLLASGGAEAVRNYFADAMLNKSIFRTTIIDKEDVLSRLEVGNLAGVTSVIEKIQQSLCAASHEPMKKLFGLQTTGLGNQTDELDSWFAYVNGWQTGKLAKLLKRIDSQILAYNKSSPEQWIYEWVQLDQIDKQEQATLLKDTAAALVPMVNAGFVLPSRAAQYLVANELIDMPEDEIETIRIGDMNVTQLDQQQPDTGF